MTKGLKGLRFYRQRAGLTQAELAEKLNTNRASVIAWESGSTWPSAATLPLIANVLQCSIDDLYSDHSTSKEECPCREEVGICMQDTGVLPV